MPEEAAPNVQVNMTPAPSPGVVVLTGKDLYDDIQSIKGMLAPLTSLPDRVENVETQLRSLQKRVYTMSGAAGVVGALFGALAGVVIKAVG